MHFATGGGLLSCLPHPYFRIPAALSLCPQRMPPYSLTSHRPSHFPPQRHPGALFPSHANNGTKGKFYLRPVYDETVELDQLADHMASHNTPFSKGQLLAVLTDFVGCIKELCMDSKTVRIDGLGIFEARVRSKGAKTLKEFTLSENILSVYVACRGVDEFRGSRLEVNTKHNLAKVLEAQPIPKENTENPVLP